MSERSIRIAVSIKDRAARQLACTMFSNAGATVKACDGAAAIREAGADLQAMVLGLGAAPEETFDALVMLRQRLATIPIYVIADTAGERSAKRATQFGATQVIPNALLERRVAHLVKQIAQAGGIEDWSIRSPGWMAPRADQGYNIESMDLGAWLAIPGNRRLLGMQEPSTEAATPTSGPAVQDERPGADRARTAPNPPLPTVTELEWIAAAPPVPEEPALEASAAPQAVAGGAPCGLGDCRFLIECRAQHEAQNAAILEVHKQRERRQQEQNQTFRDHLQADLRIELHQTVIQEITAAQVRAQARMDAFVAKVRRERSAAIHRINLILGVLGGVIVLVVLAGIGLAWRLGVW